MDRLEQATPGKQTTSFPQIRTAHWHPHIAAATSDAPTRSAHRHGPLPAKMGEGVESEGRGLASYPTVHYTRNAAPREVRGLGQAKCKLCETVFDPHPVRASGRARKYCDGCRFASGAPKPARAPRDPKTCPHCAVEFVPSHGHMKFCSPRCRSRAFYLKTQLAVKPVVYCRRCGERRDRSGHGVQLCAACRKMRDRQRNVRKANRRRAAGVMPPVDEIVAVRGDHCHICGGRIDLSLPGSHAAGLTVDHLLPVSMGGTNELANLHVAHRRCNSVRGNRVVVSTTGVG